MRRLPAITLICIVLLPVMVSAQGLRSADFLADCKKYDAACKLYITGAVETMYMLAKAGKIPPNCVPENPSFVEIQKKLEAMIAEHPDQVMVRSPLGVMIALMGLDVMVDSETGKLQVKESKCLH